MLHGACIYDAVKLLTIAGCLISVQGVAISARALKGGASIHAEMFTVVCAISTLVNSCKGTIDIKAYIYSTIDGSPIINDIACTPLNVVTLTDCP